MPLLQVLMPRIISAHSLRLQAALPGAAVHEHCASPETVSLQRVKLLTLLVLKPSKHRTVKAALLVQIHVSVCIFDMLLQRLVCMFDILKTISGYIEPKLEV